MAYEKGRQQPVAILLESPRFTANTTPAAARFIPWESMSVKNVMAYKDAGYSMGSRAALTNKIMLNMHGEGAIQSPLDADLTPFYLHYLFGQSTPVTALGATTWSFGVSQLLTTPTFTFNYKTADEGWKRVAGCLPSKVNLDVSLDDATISMDFTGIREEAGTTLTPAVPVLNKMLVARHAIVKTATTKVGLTAGTALLDVKSIKVSLETGNDIEKNKVLGSLTPANNLVDGFKCEVELELLSNAAQAAIIQGYNDNATKIALSIDIIDTNGVSISTSALKPRVYLELPPSIWLVERPIALDDLVMQKVKIMVENADLITAIVNAATPLI